MGFRLGGFREVSLGLRGFRNLGFNSIFSFRRWGCAEEAKPDKQAHAQTVKFSTRDVIVESRLPAGTGKSVKFAGPGRVKPKCDVVALLRHELLKMQPLLQSPRVQGLSSLFPTPLGLRHMP